VDGLRQQMTSLGGDLEAERQRLQQQEKRMRQQECEAKASMINWEDEKQRLQATVESLEGQIAILEDNKLKDKSNERFNKRMMFNNQEDNSSLSSSSVVLIMTGGDICI
jgi:ATPase subunit of ABC transporter with duplicated ATPase domains